MIIMQGLSSSFTVGNKAKGRISKRVFQENKECQIFRKKNIFYPLIRSRTCTYHGVKNVRFSEKLTYFVFLEHPFWDSHFCFITDDATLLKSQMSFAMRECQHSFDWIKNPYLSEISNFLSINETELIIDLGKAKGMKPRDVKPNHVYLPDQISQTTFDQWDQDFDGHLSFDEVSARKLTFPVPYICESHIEIKVMLNFYFHTFLWCPKGFMKKACTKPFWGTTSKCENKHSFFLFLRDWDGRS